ncbi:MAG: sulfatase-like hydrolase/transferase [Clostridia bacterium]
MSKRPNILIIVSDQLRHDCVGYAEKYPVMTPNLDKLARAGIVFTHAYSAIPTCCPARQSMLCGRRVESFGAYWNYDGAGGMKSPAMPEDIYTWTQELKDQGYHNGYVGKWHVHPDKDPTHFGFDEYINPWNARLERKKAFGEMDFTSDWRGEIDHGPKQSATTHWQAAKTIDMIKRYTKEDQPWHIRLDFSEPHLPCTPLKEFAELYDPDQIPVWESFGDTFENKPYIQRQQLHSWKVDQYTWEDWKHIVARYYAFITQMDDAVGQVIDFVDANGLTEDTLILFTADHGDMCGGHKMVDKHYVLYDDVVRVPLLARWTGHIQAGSSHEGFISASLDLAPTVLDLLQIDHQDKGFVGKTFAPLLRADPFENSRDCIISTFNGQQFGLYTMRMLRTKEWKYIWNTCDVDELYDLIADPNELVNLSKEPRYADFLKAMRVKIYAHLLEEGDTLVGSSWLKEQLLENLKI